MTICAHGSHAPAADAGVTRAVCRWVAPIEANALKASLRTCYPGATRRETK